MKIKKVVVIMKKLIYYYYNYNNYYNTVYNNYKRSPNVVKENGVVLNYLGRLHTATRPRTGRRAVHCAVRWAVPFRGRVSRPHWPYRFC